MPATIENEQPVSPPRDGHLPNTTRLNGSCLCAISKLGSYMSCRSCPISRSNGCICLLRMECRSELAAIPLTDDETIVLRKTRSSANSSMRDGHVCSGAQMKNLRRPLYFRN